MLKTFLKLHFKYFVAPCHGGADAKYVAKLRKNFNLANKLQ